MQRPLSTRRQSIAERSTVARSWGRSRGVELRLAGAVSDARGKCRHTHSPPQALRDSSRGGRGARHPRGLPHGLATVSVRSNTSAWSRRSAAERSTTERNIVARSWGRSRGVDFRLAGAVSEAREKPRRHTWLPQALRDSSRGGRGARRPRGLPHGLATVSVRSNTSGWSRRAATERSVVERSIVARSWGRSREGDVLQVTAVKEKPRRHNRSPRWNRDSSRNRRGTCPRGVISAASRDLPHGLAAAPLLSFAAPPPASVRSVGLSMPLLAGNGTDFVGALRKLHLAALPPQPARAGAA